MHLVGACMLLHTPSIHVLWFESNYLTLTLLSHTLEGLLRAFKKQLSYYLDMTIARYTMHEKREGEMHSL